jgi:hypothetical protein
VIFVASCADQVFFLHRRAGPRYSIGGGVDEIWGSCHGRSGISYTIETSNLQDIDTVLELFDYTTEPLTDDDDGGEGDASQIHWTCEKEADYFVRVIGYERPTGSFDLTVSEASEEP